MRRFLSILFLVGGALLIWRAYLASDIEIVSCAMLGSYLLLEGFGWLRGKRNGTVPFGSQPSSLEDVPPNSDQVK
jgi:Na+-translocating ferredoxin:NAD+ oxidoreductase RnfD subunit